MKEEMGKMNGLDEQVTAGCPSLGLPKLPGGFDGVEPVAKKSGKGKFNEASMWVSKTPHSAVFQCVLPSGRSLSALLSDGGHACMYDGNDYVCDITFANKYKGLNWSYPIVRRALNGLVSKAGKASRNRSNRKEVA